jgi:integrase/recombinase XerD
MSKPSTEFSGPLATEFAEFSELMLASGGHEWNVANMRRFHRFLSKAYPKANVLTKEMLESWLSSMTHVSALTRAKYRGSAFLLCDFLRDRDPRTATRQQFHPIRRKRTFKPYIFSHEEIAILFEAARSMRPWGCDPLLPLRMEVVVGLLYTAGLRLGELARLEIRDYDSRNACLTIRETKFRKSRQVPLSGSANRLVEEYLRRRREVGLGYTEADTLLCGRWGAPATLVAIQARTTKLMRQCGVKPPPGSGGPRIHDLRHTFAVHCILRWYREGRNVQALLPRLVTYMGHRDLESTQHYLSMTPEVLREASDRFKTFAGPDKLVEVDS